MQICPAITVGPTTLGAGDGRHPLHADEISASGGGAHPLHLQCEQRHAAQRADAKLRRRTDRHAHLWRTPRRLRCGRWNKSGCAGTRSYTFAPACTSYVISPFAMGSWDLSTSVNVTKGGHGDLGFHEWTAHLVAGIGHRRPAGLSLSSAGVLSGTTTLQGYLQPIRSSTGETPTAAPPRSRIL